MLSKRVVALSPDKAFVKRLAAGLQAAGGTVETAASLDELAKGEIQADLACVHLASAKDLKVLSDIAPRLKKDASLIVVIPSSDLAITVEAMKQPRVSVVLVADDLHPQMLASAASRLLYGDIFGLEKVVPWGVKIYSCLVGDYQEKSVAISAVSDFAASMGVRRKYRESIEQCLDELLMNALYDAPVDAQGKQLFADVPTKTRISLRMEQKAVVQYACDGNTFALSVRDSFGALKPETIVKYIDKCLHSEQQIDRKAGGAGLGLYIISNAATRFVFNLYPGVATEAICTFDLTAPKVQLKEFGWFPEKIDSSGRLVGGPSKLVGAGAPGVGAAGAAVASRGIVAALSAAIVLLLALIAIVAWPRIAGPPLADVKVTTVPAGATIELDGRTVGSTASGPLVLSDLEVGQKYKVTARLDGYEHQDEIVSPQKDTTAPVTLTLRPRASLLVFDTDPPGATVEIDGKVRGLTPLTVGDLAAGTEHEVVIRKVGYTDVRRQVRVPPPGREASVFASMVIAANFGSIDIESEPPGAQILQNGELLAGLVTPVKAHLVEAGKPYTFTLKLEGYMPEKKTVTVQAGARGTPVKAQLRPGGSLTVEVNVPEARVSVGGGPPVCQNVAAPLRDCPLPNGRYTVMIRAARPFVSEQFPVEIRNKHVTRRVELGWVETDSEDLALALPGAPKGTRRAALPEGSQKVTVVNAKTGESSQKTIRIVAGRTATVGM